jgi:deoxyhypusine synthase
MNHNSFLSKQRIYPSKPKTGKIDVDDIINYYTSSGCYNGGRLSEACKIFEKMIQENATICLTIAGALTPTGMGGYINILIERGLIDFIISTGANLYHDMHFALDLPVHQGDFRIDDRDLLSENIVRIYDIFLPEITLIETDKFIQKVSKEFNPKEPVSTAHYHYFLGKKLLSKAKRPDLSLLATAAKNEIPIFSPSPADSSIGMNLALLKLSDNGIMIDTDIDILESTAIVYKSDKTGAVELGGGAPKNFYMQTQPMISQIMNKEGKGHDYFIQITADAPHWGGLSGATPSEAISWKKVNPNKIKNDVVVYCDVTIAAPLIFSYILSKKYKRNKKALYHKLDYLLNTLKNTF